MKYAENKFDNTKNKKHITNNYVNYFIFLVRLIICLLVATSVFIIKIINNKYYNCIKKWYNFQINDSLVTDGDFRNQNFCLRNIVPINLTVDISEPVKNGIVTSRFGNRKDPINKNIENKHKGIDIASDFGNDIFSVLPGVVKLATYYGGYGRCVIVDHGNNIQTLYAHCDNINVKCGDIINKGQKIAVVGKSGRTTGPHVHFELIVNGLNFDPECLLNKFYTKNNEI